MHVRAVKFSTILACTAALALFPAVAGAFYYPPANTPPGPPPNYTQIDSSYFDGTPVLPDPPPDSGGFYIWREGGRWTIANHIFSLGNSLEQFHGSILAILEQPPQLNVNVVIKDFELFGDTTANLCLDQNDRWGWVQWGPDLYEIWWDVTTKEDKSTGHDLNDIIEVTVAGCALDFNIWTSAHGTKFGADMVYLGAAMTPLSSIPEFIDFYQGISDPYQAQAGNDPEGDPNITIFTPRALPGASFNRYGQIATGDSFPCDPFYGQRYTGSFAYEGNGLQFSTNCTVPENQTPAVDFPGSTRDTVFASCPGDPVCIEVIASDPDAGDTLTLTLLEGPVAFAPHTGAPPLIDTVCFVPDTSGSYRFVWRVEDRQGAFAVDTTHIVVHLNRPPAIVLPNDQTVDLCLADTICIDGIAATDPDSAQTGTPDLRLIEGTGTFDAALGTLCFLPDDSGGTYRFVFEACDSCAASCVRDTLTVSVALNRPPFVAPPPTPEPFACVPGDQTVCIEGWTFGDPDLDQLTFSTLGSGTFDPQTGTFCTPVSAPGQYTQTLVVSDSCGLTDKKTLTFEVLPNDLPVVHVNAPDSILLCGPDTLCVDVTADDDGGVATLAANIGTLADGKLCLSADTAGLYTLIVTATDSCEAAGADTAQVRVYLDRPPVIEAPSEAFAFICAGAGGACLETPVVITDPDSGDEISVGLPPGVTLDSATGTLCILDAETNTYAITITATDACGLSDTATISVQVEVGTTPQIQFSVPDTTVYVCDPDTQLCFYVTATDESGTPPQIEEILNPGFFDAGTGRFCFNPDSICFDHPETIDTTICLIFSATNACGTTIDTLCVTVVSNQPPEVALPADTTVRLCAPGPVCIGPVIATDPDDDVLELQVTGPATLDEGSLCFEPDTAGTYTFVVCATDPCGHRACDSVKVTVTFDAPPSVTLPADFRQVLCAPGTFCFAPLEIADPDDDSLQVLVTGGTWDGQQICVNAPSAGVHTVILSAVDPCGRTAADTVKITVALNSPPHVLIKQPKPLTLCDIDTVLCYAVKVTDIDGAGSATLKLVKTDGRIWSLQGSQLCLDATAALAGRNEGLFEAIVEATDPCGATGRDTIVVALKANRPPFVELPPDSQVTLCAPGEVCITPLAWGDPDGGPLVVNATGGTWIDSSYCAFADRDTTLVFTLSVTDSCGLSASDTTRVTVMINAAPVVQLPEVSAVSVCAFDTICIDGILGMDPDSGPLPVTMISGSGDFDAEAGRLCFIPDGDGAYSFTFVAADACAADTGTLTIAVTANQPPAFGESPDVSRFACTPGDSICLTFAATDPEDDAVTYEVAAGPGAIGSATGVLCFVPDTAGLYTFVVSATDSCGHAVYDTGYAQISFNRAPTLQFSMSDTTLAVCALDTQLCFVVTATDADGDAPVIREILNPGNFDPQTGTVCFNPADICFGDVCSEDTTVCLIFAAADACGAETIDTLCLRLLVDRPPHVDLGPDTSAIFCEPGAFCLPLADIAVDPDGDPLEFSVSGGGYLDEQGQVCIDVDTSGRYTLILCAQDPCGGTGCDTLVIDAAVNAPPVVVLPADSTVVACSIDSVCIPYEAYDPDAGDQLQITVGGGAVLRPDHLCFAPSEGDGVYTFVVTATDACGAVAADTVAITVDVNDPPYLVFSSPDTSISVCRADTELCFSVTAVDPDGEAPQIEEVLVPGFFNPETGAFCFNPDSICFSSPHTMDTTVCVVFRATDACGAVTYDSLCITLLMNRAPEVHFSVPDTTLFLCRPDTLLCFDVWGSDPEGDAVVISEIRNPGAYFPETGQFCFNPDSICFNGLVAETSFCVIFKATDACGNSTVDSLCLNLFANRPPLVETPDTVDAVICAPGEEVCVSPVVVSDPDGGQPAVLVPGATYDSLLHAFCFTADSVGTYLFTVTATDECLAQTSAPVVVRVHQNAPPVISLPADTSVFVCGPGPLCFDWSVSDPELDSLAIILSADGGTAYLDTTDGRVCVMIAEQSGPIRVTITASDPCGASGVDSFTVTPLFNRPPVVALPADFEVTVCAQGEYCFDPAELSDPDGNFDPASVAVSGGRYDAATGKICIDVAAAGAYPVIVTAADSCGAQASDTVVVSVTVNRPPVTSFSVADTAIYLCQPDSELCFVFAATDPDGDLVVLDEILNPGSFDAATGRFCFRPSEVCFNNPNEYDTTICLIFVARDECGASTFDTLCLELTANVPPVVVAPPDTTVRLCEPGEICLAPFDIFDPNGGRDTLSIAVAGPAHLFDTATGVICFTGGAGSYTFVATATDRCGATSSDSVTVTVAPNSPPAISLPADYTTLVCSSEEVCFPVELSDPDVGDAPEVSVTGGTYHPESGEICFAPAGAGVFTLIATATDGCGATDVDTIRVTVEVNAPPAWSVVPAIDSFLCAAPPTFCFQVTAIDPDGQPVRYALISGPGAIDSVSGQLCFSPQPATQTYTFVVRARDACGASAVDTATVKLRINGAPVLTPPNDTSDIQCTPTPFCFSPIGVSDPDGDPVTLQKLSGPGTLSGNQLCFTPDTPGVAIYCFSVRGTDPCGRADTTNFCVQLKLNRAPVLTVPDDFTEFLCDSAQVCFGGITATDPDGEPVTLTKVSGPGTFTAGTGQVCFAPAKGGGVYTFVFRATDACGSQDQDTVVVTVKVNGKPSISVPPAVTNCLDSTICISIATTDPDNGQALSVTQVSGPAGTFSPSPLTGPAPLSGQWCWNPTATGTYPVVFRVTDACGATALDTTVITVDAYCDTLCFQSRIALLCPDAGNPNQWMFQGRTTVFSVTTNVSRPVGAFDFLIGYDATALSLLRVTPGGDISAWEFFTFRIVDPNATCSGVCPSGLVRIVGIADINNGAPISDPSQTLPGADPREFAKLEFVVSNDRTLAGQFIPVTFWWNDCGDNTFSSPEGDLYVASKVDPDTCVVGGKEAITRCCQFYDGGGCIPRASDIDERGDLNLNGIAYEIADAVLYSNYFISGPSVLDIDPIRRESQIAASDVNADGAPLTVADLVFLIRVILGLEDPIDDSNIGGPKLQAAGHAQVIWSGSDDGGAVSITSSSELGAAAFTMSVDGQVDRVVASDALQRAGLTLDWKQDGTTLRMLVYSLKGATLPAGEWQVATVHGPAPGDIQVDLADGRGRTLDAEVRRSGVRPQAFELAQNQPNPFNPATEIRFTLYRQAEVRLTVFNLLGRVVGTPLERTLLPAGEYSCPWQARDRDGLELPSGVYMYRLEVDDRFETRKMLLLR